MIVDCFERPVFLGDKAGVRQMYMLGHKGDYETFGHVTFDCADSVCFIHAQVYKKDIKSLREMRTDILDLIDEVLIQEWQYDEISSYTPDRKFLNFIVRGRGWKVREYELPGFPDITLCMVNLTDKEEQCPKS